MPRFPAGSRAAAAMPASIFARLVDKLPEDRSRLFPFHLGDTHLLPPPAGRVEELAWPEDARALYAYGPPAGERALLEAVCAKLAARNGLRAATDEVQITCGATHAFSCAARAVLDPNDEVLLLAPYWPLIRGIVQSVGARPVEVPFYSRLYEGVEDVRGLVSEYVTPRTAAIYLTTPNNPDGKVLSAGQVAAVAGLARELDLWVLADEVYEDFTFDGRAHVSLASLPGMAARTLTVFSFSKSYGQAGLRVGYVAGPASVMTALRRLANHSVYNVPHAMQLAALAALRDGAAFLEEARRGYQEARDATVAALRAVAAPVHAPEGGAYVFLDLSRWGDSCYAVLERLAARGVLLAPGDAFGREYGAWARLCYTAVPRERLEAGLEVMAAVLASG